MSSENSGGEDESEGNGSSESSGLSAPAPKRGERGARGIVTQGHSSERRVRGGIEWDRHFRGNKRRDELRLYSF